MNNFSWRYKNLQKMMSILQMYAAVTKVRKEKAGEREPARTIAEQVLMVNSKDNRNTCLMLTIITCPLALPS